MRAILDVRSLKCSFAFSFHSVVNVQVNVTKDRGSEQDVIGKRIVSFFPYVKDNIAKVNCYDKYICY